MSIEGVPDIYVRQSRSVVFIMQLSELHMTALFPHAP
jgi:hypothetical protein